MTPEEKAEELIDKYYTSSSGGDDGWMTKGDAIICAIICCDEIMDNAKDIFAYYKETKHFEFWQQVKDHLTNQNTLKNEMDKSK